MSAAGLRCALVDLPPFRPRIVPAEGREGAFRAPRSDWPTEILAETNEEFVDVEPVLLRDAPHEPLLRRLRRLRANESKTVAHAVDVRVRRDPRLSEPVDEDAVRRLRPNLRELDEFLVRARNLPVMMLEESPAHVPDLGRLLLVEADGHDEALAVPRSEERRVGKE